MTFSISSLGSVFVYSSSVTLLDTNPEFKRWSSPEGGDSERIRIRGQQIWGSSQITLPILPDLPPLVTNSYILATTYLLTTGGFPITRFFGTAMKPRYSRAFLVLFTI